MGRSVEDFGTLTIASGSQSSNVIANKTGFAAAIDLLMFSPSSDEGFQVDAFEQDAFQPSDPSTDPVTVLVAFTESPGDTDFVTLQVGGTDLSLSPGKATSIPVVGFKALKVRSAAAEAGARTYRLFGQCDLGHGGTY